MSKNHDKEDLFTNEDTLVRRAWIDSALDSVRSRLGGTPDNGESSDCDEESGQSAAPAAAPGSDSERPERPKLYVAWSATERRSGT
jgi:hypothetical protein